jgi:uncharacterized protein YabE (DUF348 family)/3D (Asp-Asp-Asp) domain-containing protein
MIEKKKKARVKGKHSILKIGMAGVIITCVIGTASSFVFAKEVKVTVDNKERVLSGGMFQNVGDILEQNGIKLGDDYSANVDPNSVLLTVGNIEVKSVASGELTYDGKTVIYKSDAETVGDLIDEYGIQLGDLDRVVPSKSATLEDGQAVKVIRVKVAELPSRQVINYTTQNKDNPELEAGKTKVVQVGVNGESSVVERVLYEDGIETKREVIYDQIVKDPIPEIVEVGTKAATANTAPATQTQVVVTTPAVQAPVAETPAVETPTVTTTPAAATPVETTTAIPENAVKTTIQCTAYTATGNATASGVMPTANHTVAAWSGLPFGTKIYIPALGITYTVEDRGGAVTEGIVDIYMDTYEQCIQFGRQNLEAYIIY